MARRSSAARPATRRPAAPKRAAPKRKSLRGLRGGGALYYYDKITDDLAEATRYINQKKCPEAVTVLTRASGLLDEAKSKGIQVPQWNHALSTEWEAYHKRCVRKPRVRDKLRAFITW